MVRPTRWSVLRIVRAPMLRIWLKQIANLYHVFKVLNYITPYYLLPESRGGATRPYATLGLLRIVWFMKVNATPNLPVGSSVGVLPDHLHSIWELAYS
jgi:hypothetical protein